MLFGSAEALLNNRTNMAIIDKERAENLYKTAVYERNTSNWEDSASIFRANAFYAALLKAQIAHQSNKILDVGCGSGGVLMNLSRLHGSKIGRGCARYDGIDLSPNAIKVANRIYPNAHEYNVNFSSALVDDPHVDANYSIISLIHVLEHCPDMLEMLSVCEKKSSYLYINVPIEVNLFYTFRRQVLVNQYLSYGHLHFFNEPFFLCWLENNGFDILATVYSPDFEIQKRGVGYKAVQLLRRIIGLALGPAITTWLLGGYSFGVIVRSRISSNTKTK